ncbi:MAG: phosphatase PAP2 family protein [Parafannyhessea sp.]|uniref:phosphatase PAP2 family protein n=1 Tax=Parafannyhessea sp. TaxID=2847324 RepID=UPI003F03545C
MADGQTGASRARGVLARIRRERGVLIGAAAVIVFIWLLFEIEEKDIFRLDAAAYYLIVVNMRQPWLTPIMRTLSDLATPIVLVVMLLMVEEFAPGRRPGLCAAVNLVLATLLNQGLKYLIQRPRPAGYRLATVSGYSFPSGHSMAAMAFYGLLIWMVWRYEKDEFVKWLGVLGFGAVIVLVGFSRIYLGVHYASDVLAGFCASIAWLAVYTKLVAPYLMGEPASPSSGPSRPAR